MTHEKVPAPKAFSPDFKHFTDDSGWCWCEPDVLEPCPECANLGRINAACWWCHGTGRIPVRKDTPGAARIVVHRDR